MLIGDSVLLQKDGKIFRPSDVGTPVEMTGTWTLRFTNGAVLTTTEDTYFVVLNHNNKPVDMSLSNMTNMSRMYKPEPIAKPIAKWNSKVELSDYTHSSGIFDMSDLNFARFAGFFITDATKDVKTGGYLLNKKKFAPLEGYAKALYPEDSFKNYSEKFIAVQKCWVDELLDVFFDFNNVPSIPDELILDLPEDWAIELGKGVCDASTFDKAGNAYIINLRMSQFMSDYGIIMTRIKYPFRVTRRQWGAAEKTYLTVTFKSLEERLMITDGYENVHPQVVYDVGKGEFNASNILVKDD